MRKILQYNLSSLTDRSEARPDLKAYEMHQLFLRIPNPENGKNLNKFTYVRI